MAQGLAWTVGRKVGESTSNKKILILMIKFIVHTTESESNQRALETTFDIVILKGVVGATLLFKDARWTDMRTR